MRELEIKILALCIPVAWVLGGVAIIIKLVYPDGF